MTSTHRSDGNRGPESDRATSLRSHLRAATDAASDCAVDAATTTARSQLTFLLGQREVPTQIGRRFGRLGSEQQQGHVFEWMHELSFNLDAIAKGNLSRAFVTTWTGRPHDPADLVVLDGSASTAVEVQAKVIARAAQRLSRQGGVSDEKYDGMGLLLPRQHRDEAQELLARRLTMPRSPLTERYESVQARLTDRVHHDGVTSKSVTSEQLKRATEDPEAHLQGLVDDNHLAQALKASGAAAVVGGLAGGVTSLIAAQRENGDFSDVNWVEVADASGAAAAQSAAISAGGQFVSLAAQHAVAEGATGLAEALAGGTLPFALARGTWEIAAISHGWATGRMSNEDAAEAATEVLTRTVAVWACAAIGQTLIPIPVVGSMVGAVVGQQGAAMMAEGVRIAVAARAAAHEWEAKYAALLVQTESVRAQALVELEQLHELSSRYSTTFDDRILPLLDRLAVDIGCASTDKIMDDLAVLIGTYAGTPVFRTSAQFDAFMADPDLRLALDLGGA